MLKTIAVLAVSFAGVAYAQERKITNEPETPAATKRLQSVTWDLKLHKLTWVVETGKLEGRDFVPTGSNHYEISPDEAEMQFAEETRGFSPEEAMSLHRLLDTLSVYCAESVIWWDQEHGEKADPEHRKERKTDEVDKKDETRPKPNPADQVAGLRWAIVRSLR